MHKKNSKPSSSPSKVTPAKRDDNTPPPVVKETKRPKADASPSKSSMKITLSDGEKPDALLDNTDKMSEASHPLSNLTKTVHNGSLAEHADKNVQPTPVIEADDAIVSGFDVNVAPSPVIEDPNKDVKIERARSPTPVIKPNLKSFFHSFMANKPVMVLPRVNELGISYGDPTAYPIMPFVLADHVGGNENKAEHILKYALAAEGTNLYNLFSVQPRNFRYSIVNKSNDGRKIVRASDNLDASFYMVGRVTHCSLENGEYNKEINIQPLGRLLPRCVAVIAQILKFQQPVFSVYKDGLTISSYRKPMEGQKEPKIKPVAMNGETHGPPICAWNQEVPMFSGRLKFALTHYPSLPAADIKFGDYALVVFTIGGYRSREDVECVSLNVQFAIQLESHADKDTQAAFDSFYEDFGDETPIGVDDTRVMERYSGDVTDIPISVLPSGPVM